MQNETQVLAYTRVSTSDQNSERQTEVLTGLYPDARIYGDALSGKNTKRPGLQRMLADMEPGNLIAVHSIDRLCRSLRDLWAVMEAIEKAGAYLHIVKDQIDTREGHMTPSARLLLNLKGLFAEYEREIINARVKEGVEIAKSKGVYKNIAANKRKDGYVDPNGDRWLSPSSIDALIRDAGTIKPMQLAEKYGVSVRTVYRHLKADRIAKGAAW